MQDVVGLANGLGALFEQRLLVGRQVQRQHLLDAAPAGHGVTNGRESDFADDGSGMYQTENGGREGPPFSENNMN